MKFNFKRLDYDMVIEAIDVIKKGESVEDYIGSIYIGQLEIALFLKRGLTNGSVVKYEINVGGVDSEYGYTTDGNLPYDFGGAGILITSRNISLFESYDKFKKQTIDTITQHIRNSDYHFKGTTLLDKANDMTPFDWD